MKASGALFNSARTPEQTDLGLFWFSNYLVLWNHALRDIAAAHVHNIGDSARLFALANLAMADAAITAWDTKFHYVFWRPVTAIQEGDNDGNPETTGDQNWQPLVNNPNYPDYTSGANNVTGATTRALALFFGTNEMTFSVTTTNPAAIQQTRTYDRFTDAAADVVNARIYEGIHFRFADVEARKQGRRVAARVLSTSCSGSKMTIMGSEAHAGNTMGRLPPAPTFTVCGLSCVALPENAFSAQGRTQTHRLKASENRALRCDERP